MVREASFAAIAQARAEIHGHENFVSSQLDGKVGAGYLRMGQAGAFDPGVAKVQAAQVGTTKIGVGEVDGIGVHVAQVEPAKVAAGEVDLDILWLACIEAFDIVVVQEVVERMLTSSPA